jgi:hypothetical protein
MESSNAGPTTPNPSSELSKALKGLLFPIFFIVMFTVCYISAFHNPTPHNVKVAIIGPPEQTTAMIEALAPSVAGSFKISQIATTEEAQRAIRDRKVFGALELTTPPTLYYASGNGSGVNGAVQGLFRSLAAQQGQPLTIVDLVALPKGDLSGTGIFYFAIICTLAGYLTVTVLGQSAPNLDPLVRLGLIAGIAIFAPVVIYLIGGVGMGIFDVSASKAVALIAIGALYAFGIGVVARALQLILGQAAVIAMMTIFVFLNFPSSGGAIQYEMLPSFWRFFNHFWIGASLVGALRSLLFFDNQDLWKHLAVLLAWIVGWLAVLALPIHRIRHPKPAGDLEIATIPSPVN